VVGQAGRAWENHTSPFAYLRAAGSVGGGKLINNYLSRRMQMNEENERNALKAVLHQVLMRPASSEVAITMIL